MRFRSLRFNRDVLVKNSNLDNYIGEKIKFFAETLLWIGFIVSFVCAIVFGKSYTGEGSYVFNFWYFLLILIGGSFLSYINYLLLYGFGSLVQSSINAENNTAELLEQFELNRKDL